MSAADLAVFKVLCSVCLGLSSVVGVVAPIGYVRKQLQSSTSSASASSSMTRVAYLLSIANAGSAGLLIGAGLLHFLGEAISGAVSSSSSTPHLSSGTTTSPGIDEYQIESGVHTALLLFVSGILLPLLIDKVLLAVLGGGGGDHHGHSHNTSDLGLMETPPLQDHHAVSIVSANAITEESSRADSSASSTHSRGANGGGPQPPQQLLQNRGAPNNNTSPSFSSKVVMIAILLAVHSAMEGAALGMERTVLSLRAAMVPMLLHKFFDGLILGVSIAKKVMTSSHLAGNSIRSLIPYSVIGFTFVTPIAMCITAVTGGDKPATSSVVNHEEGSAVVSSLSSLPAAVIVQGLGAGSFLYIALVEIIPEEFSSSSSGGGGAAQKSSSGGRSRTSRGNALKWFTLALGCALVQFLESGHHHDHSGGHHHHHH